MPIYLGGTAIGGSGGGTVIEGTGLLSVDDIPALRSVASPTANQIIFVRCHTVDGDRGGGIFRYDIAETGQMVSAATINAAGTAYTVGSEPRVNGGVGTVAVLHVDSIGASGEVTGLRILNPGRYTTNPSTSGVATTWAWGAGFTVNLTLVPYDNNGTVINSTGNSGAGRWVRIFNGPVDVRWFGARPDVSTTTSHDQIQAAVAAHDAVIVSEGDFYISKPIVLKHKSTFSGIGTNVSAIRGVTGFSECLVRTFLRVTSTQSDTMASYRKQVDVKDLTFKGDCLHALALIRGNMSYVNNIRLEGAAGAGVCTTLSHGMVIEDCWTSSFNNLWFNGSSIPTSFAALCVGRDANACHISNVTTSNTCNWGIYHRADSGVSGHGTVYSNICVQGHEDVGFWLRSNGYNGTTINGLYSESCRAAIRFGDRDSIEAAVAVSFNGGVLMSGRYVDGAPGNIQIMKGRNISITGVSVSNSNFVLTNNPSGDKKTAIYVDSAYNVRFSGVTVSQDSLLINHMARAPSGGFIDVHYSERNTTITGHPTVTWSKPAGTGVPAGKLIGTYFQYDTLAIAHITDMFIYTTTWTFT